MTGEVRAAFLSKSDIPIITGGGITGDCQINETRLHSKLKLNYREQESALMIEKLKEDPKRIFFSYAFLSRDDNNPRRVN